MLTALRIIWLGFLLVFSTALLADEATSSGLMVDGRERHYLLYDFSGAEPAPLVLVLHGGGGNGHNAMEQTGFNRVGEREGLVVVYPYGSSRLFGERLLTWNADHCCSHAMRSESDDIGFIAALIDHLVETGAVDPQRVYVTGLSNGGMLTHRLGLALPDRITAIAPVIAGVFGDESRQAGSMPVLIINGAEDTIVKPEGGALRLNGLLGRRAATSPILPIQAQRLLWSDINGCLAHEQSSTNTYVKHVYSGCRQDVTVEHYIVSGNGHAWPGGTAPRDQADQPVQTFDANEFIWEFFSRYPAAPVQP